jgi:hypothetical protein
VLQTPEELQKDEEFFGPKEAVKFHEPKDHDRKLFYFDCREVVFLKDEKVLCIAGGSAEGQLPANIGVKVFAGRSICE